MAPTLLLFLMLFVAGFASAQLPQNFEILQVDTDTSLIPLDDILMGALPQVGIPALGFAGDWTGMVLPSPAPQFVAQWEAERWLAPDEPVVVATIGNETRAYPVQILLWHEIINDTIDGVPVTISYCPLCNSAVVFDRRVPLDAEARDRLLARNPNAQLAEIDTSYLATFAEQLPDQETPAGAALVTFGVSGMLYNANVLMFDDSSSTIWSQILGTAMVGTLSGARLLRYPTQLVSFADFREGYPEAQVMSRQTGFGRGYGSSVYSGYDRPDSEPMHFRGEVDERLPAKARVVALESAGTAIAYPFEDLERIRVINSNLGSDAVVVFWHPGTRSALDTSAIANGRDVGAVAAYSRYLDDLTLSFVWDGEHFVDEQTGSLWNLMGQATDGPLAGEALEPIVHVNTFWFAWAAFHPETQIFGQAASTP